MIKRAPRPETNFTVLTNEILRDERLSFRARGILASILSRPDNWRTDAESLARESTEGRTAILTALKELENTGYLVRIKFQNEKGHWVTEQVIHDRPLTDSRKPNAGYPTSDEPTSDNLTLYKELSKKNLEETIYPPEGGNASHVVAKYVDSFVELFGDKPPSRHIGRIAREARQLLDEGKDFERLLDAAQDCAGNGHANLTSSYTWALAENQRQQPGAAGGWLRLVKMMEEENLEIEQ